MDRLIYTAMTGANAATQLQSVLANNLANASTGGFRAELNTYRSVPVQGPGLPTRTMTVEATSGYSSATGTVQRTDRNLDAMAKGNSWFAVQALDGTEAYTRNGAFEVSPTGTLTNSTGLPVLTTDGAPVSIPPNADLTLGDDGTITAATPGQPPTTLGKLKLITPTDDDPIKRGADGLFRTTTGDPANTDPNARLQTGVVEGSNVNAVETMVAMIQTGRQFENQMQLLQNAESNDKSATALLSMQ